MLVLASTSRYRSELLARLGIPFACEAPGFDESTLESRFAELSDPEFALELALRKASSVAERRPGSWILAADQIAVLERPRRLLHKPGTRERAVEQLMLLAGTSHTLTTGVVLLRADDRRCESGVDQHRIFMRAYSRAEAQAYVDEHRPLDCVGAFRVEDAGIRLMERIEGADYTGIIGLPLLTVCALLRRVGLLPD